MGETYDIDYLLEEVVTLPSLSSTVAHVTEMLNDPDVTLSEVGWAIASDPALALKALRLVNSAYYGLREKITSVEHAVVLLGGKVVRNLVFTAAVFETFGKGEERLLRHSIGAAIALRVLNRAGAAKKVEPLDSEEAFVFGLLHDIGKIILRQYLPNETKEVERLSEQEGMLWHEAEQQVIGVDHAELGCRLAMKWKLPDRLAYAIGGHHDLSRCNDLHDKGAAALLSVADYICYSAGYGGLNGPVPKLAPAVWETTGLTSRSIQPALEEFFRMGRDVNELVSLAA